MINMEHFQYANMHADNTVTVGSGTKLQDMTAAVYNAGREISELVSDEQKCVDESDFPIAIGACPCVGAMGVMLGGGVGRLQGKHGLMSDAVRKVRLALYNGTILEASEDINPDLFWGIRGAGQNFGVVIEATFETYPQSNGGEMYSADMIFTGEHIDSIIDAMNSLYPVDENLALLIFYVANATTLEVCLVIARLRPLPSVQG